MHHYKKIVWYPSVLVTGLSDREELPFQNFLKSYPVLYILGCLLIEIPVLVGFAYLIYKEVEEIKTLYSDIKEKTRTKRLLAEKKKQDEVDKLLEKMGV
jgi:hypothetical protein